ncbi:MAG: SDR family oxidoreductase, partial [Deltaproteobacteria bacterium]
MKVLYIGGTGQISHACVLESLSLGHEVTMFNRGTTGDDLPVEVKRIHGEMNDATYRGLDGYDAICQFIAFKPDQVEKDIATFAGKTGQYVFISSASAYLKPVRKTPITEDVPLINPFWQYSRDKAACEAVLQAQDKLPFTIIRPSHTVRTRLPTAIGDSGTCVHRVRQGKPVVVHGDGTTFWTVTRSEDLAKPFARLLGNAGALGEDFHITSDLSFTFDDIHETIARMMGFESQIVHVASDTLARYNPDWLGGLLGDKSHTVQFDNSKVKAVAGDFSCVQTLEEVLENPVKFAQDLPPDL